MRHNPPQGRKAVQRDLFKDLFYDAIQVGSIKGLFSMRGPAACVFLLTRAALGLGDQNGLSSIAQ